MTTAGPSANEQPLASKTESVGEEEKTIPFLRRLRDMLLENEDIVSFCAGSRNNGKTVLGRIVVHDRARVEAEVLPRYFNHASFASLRRQLNYFSFTRLGKGRQRGATYCNEGVVELDDILLLRRRPSGANAGPRAPSPPKEQTEVQPPEEQLNAQSVWTDTSAMATANHVVPFVHLAPSKPKRKATDAAATETDSRNSLRKKSRFFKRSSPPPMISPLSSTANSEDELAPPQVILDLTVPSARIGRSQFHEWKLNPICGAFDANTAYDDGNEEPSASPSKDQDIMAGCQALLSISQGTTSRLGFV